MYTIGKQYQLKDGTQYIGNYIKLPNGSIFSGKVYKFRISKMLYPYVIPKSQNVFTGYGERYIERKGSFTFKEQIKLNPPDFSIQIIQELPNIITRYFVFKDNILLQVNKQSSQNVSQNQLYQIQWMIKGTTLDKYKHNKKEILKIQNNRLFSFLLQNINTL